MEDYLFGLTKANCLERITKVQIAIKDKSDTLEYYSSCNLSDKTVDRLADLINEYKDILEELEKFKKRHNL